ncbi:unnamed protein product [Prunus armeniaca]|uniref:O-acyltransferase WSD1 C-terminal domain-containing protein n=1 Tax=Prunus armeniaca TaxID=36596 RepID=A0A6J5WXW3_PRUAR|nr:unnamed protein product [Prunus armeniaca]CAB4303914.1 unnamed protein product [Prunus armeniaca]
MALADHPVRGFYFMVLVIPQEILIISSIHVITRARIIPRNCILVPYNNFHSLIEIMFQLLILQDLIVTVVDYMGKLRIAIGTQKGLIDPEKFKACMENAFKMILEATDNISMRTY